MDDLRLSDGGGDRRVNVLEQVLADALERPELRQAVAEGTVTRQDLVDAVTEAEASVFAPAADAERRYLAGATGSGPLNPVWRVLGFLTRLLLLVVVPFFGFGGLGYKVLEELDVTAPVRDHVVLVLGSAPIVVGSAMMVWWRSRSIPVAWAFTGYGAVLVTFVWVVLLQWQGLDSVLPLVAVVLGAGTMSRYVVVLAGRVLKPPDSDDRAFDLWRTALLEEGVLPVLYARVNQATQEVYSTALTVREATGLVRSDHLRMHVPTPASARLVRLVGRLDGGSFAIAGPRGAGKTNLLRAFCGGRYRGPDRAPDLAVLVSAPVEYVPQEFVVHLFAETCEAVQAHFRQPVDRRRALWRRVSPHPLVSAARDNLVLLRYVRTYADEVSGKGGFKGFELAGKRALTMTGRALTYPELVKRFREFLTRVSAELAVADERRPGRVLIGIDELDRIGTGEPARRFLNEIKAIFDVPGCHYLVSVSTEAQYDFELSGMGLRSVFDSSFDEVVRVDYLDFQYARKLLRRYVLGLSEQFHALAYAFSGGLARQLVRTARAIVELGRERSGRDIAEVARELAEAELVRACQATADALTGVDDRDGVTKLLRLLDEGPESDLKTYGDAIRAAYNGRSDRARQLRDAIAARVHFLATVTRTFTADLTEERMAALDFDVLARARRYAGTNPDAGLALLRDINQRWGT